MSWTILTMSLLRFWALTVVVPLLSMQGQKALGFHQKYLDLCSEDEWRSYGFGTTWGWVINDRICIFEWTVPLIVEKKKLQETLSNNITVLIKRCYKELNMVCLRRVAGRGLPLEYGVNVLFDTWWQVKCWLLWRKLKVQHPLWPPDWARGSSPLPDRLLRCI